MGSHDYYDYDDYGRYGEGGFEKSRSRGDKRKYKGKGHQSRRGDSDRWEEILADDGSDLREAEVPTLPVSREQPRKGDRPFRKADGAPSEPRKFVPNPETTKSIKGVDIDFSGVVAMDKENSTSKGYETYGIKFTFKGSKGLYRIVWFNKNRFLRDKIYDEKREYWESLQGKAKE